MAAKQVYIAVVGTGGVGKCFLSQLELLTKRTAAVPKDPKLNLVLVASSKKVLFSADYAPLNPSASIGQLASSTQPPKSVPEIIEYLSSVPHKSPAVFVDNTSSQEIADNYPTLLQHGIHVITPNKKAFSGSYEAYTAIVAASAASGAKWYNESAVGAGLPVISTLKDLIRTGDQVERVEGVFSGTMSFLFNSFQPLAGQGGKWSAEVAKAKDLGYTEPDPRDDLNGLDVARKLTILARQIGMTVESPTSFPIDNLIPKELVSCASGEEFMKRLPEFDAQMEQTRAEAEKEGKVVRFVGSIDVRGNKLKVGLEKLEKSHPIAGLKGSDNIINFYTQRYGAQPLIIQGAGAGGETTAMGITGDLCKLLETL